MRRTSRQLLRVLRRELADEEIRTRVQSRVAQFQRLEAELIEKRILAPADDEIPPISDLSIRHGIDPRQARQVERRMLIRAIAIAVALKRRTS